MGDETVLIVALAATLAVLVLCVPVLSFQVELWRVNRRYELSKEEEKQFARDLPEVRRAIAESLGPDASTREVNRMARESIIAAIIRQRERRGRAPLSGVDIDEPGVGDSPELAPGGPHPGRVTREDLARGRSPDR